MYSLIIVGAGPAGISLAVEARAAGLAADQILVLEKAKAHSWVIRSLYPDKKLVTANYKGIEAKAEGLLAIPDQKKHETINFLDNAIANTGVEVHYEEEVVKVHALDCEEKPCFEVETSKGRYKTRTVAIAIGIFGRPRKPDYKIPRELRLAKRIHFDVTSFEATGEKILVVGGGDTASEDVQFLVEHDNEVSLSYRGAEFFRMNPLNKQTLLALAKAGKVELLLETNIESLEVGPDNKPVVHFKEIAPRTFDRIVYALGGTTPENFLKMIGIEFDKDTPVIDEYGETGIKGLFLSGDLSMGKRGGSIMAAFNSSRRTIEGLCIRYLHCVVPVDKRDINFWLRTE